MSLLLFPVVMAVLGLASGHWWAVGVPILIGAVLAIVFETASATTDTPLLLMMVLGAAATAAGVLARQRFAPA